MEYSRKKIENKFTEATALTLGRVVHSGKCPDSKLNQQVGRCMPWHRFAIILGGEYHLDCFIDGSRRITPLHKGDVIIQPPFNWSSSTPTSDYSVLSIVLERNYLRLVYLNYFAELDNYWPPDFYYHIEDTINETVILAIRALTSAGDDNYPQEDKRRLTECILKMILHDLHRSTTQRHGKAYATWLDISRYVEENFQRKISRAELSKNLGVSQVYISKLFQRFAGESMTSYTASLRLENAAFWLRESSESVDQIAWRCGYETTSFFRKLFKRRFGVTPSVYKHAAKKHAYFRTIGQLDNLSK